jgi:predicted acylesterase/phospholipase RssA
MGNIWKKTYANLLFVFFVLSVTYMQYIYSFNLLSLSGGGSYGAIQIGLLKKINEIEQKKYDAYTGVSIGAINVFLLSYFENIHDGIIYLENKYLTSKNSDFIQFFPLNKFSLLNTNKTYNYLNDRINEFKFNQVYDVYVGITNLEKGIQEIFRLNNYNTCDKLKLLMATSCVPILFPPIRFEDQLYVDGGLLKNYLLNTNRKYSDNDFINITFIDTTTYNNGNNLQSEFSDIYESKNTKSIHNFYDVMSRSIELFCHNKYEKNKNILQYKQIKKIGRINHFFVSRNVLKKYSPFNFKKSKQLIDVGYTNLQCDIYYIYKTDINNHYILKKY